MGLSHVAIRTLLDEIESVATALDKKKLKTLEKLFEEAERVIGIHASQEDEVFYPAISKLASRLTDAFSWDHKHEHDNLFPEIEVPDVYLCLF